MASLVNSSLDLLRRRKTQKHPQLHARWGDVSISAPTEGAWTQFNNPYQREKVNYGPGFVPGCSADDDNSSDGEEASQESRSKKSVLKSRRLTRILAPSTLNTTSSKKSQERENQTGFEYKPVRPDYAQEVAENVDKQNVPRFRYVPASQNYLRDLVTDLQPETEAVNLQPARSRSCEPPAVTLDEQSLRLQPRGVQETMGRDYRRGLSSSTMPRRTSHDSNVSGVREEERVKQKKKTGSSLQRSQSTMKPRRPMTLTMVSDPDDLW
ncbi:hypothetical protein VTN96DRAFT_3779 [Rasamsonia emersonii]|uniref:Uncharacterized protein n=1 Tax=Rasamsonia emersonii (strain ATCC 16479 / CBS 393.64 / IMI 116815) TaxID=1408163 RepID=A0A0F4YLS1_RASE3|nr:hypothetical protein T310_6971 [Rasamsonia emersonii CBS 393.64]KKA19070.1 hypothetical protein T310_6971 [Rasamsonia emersonii CBS 393.64]